MNSAEIISGNEIFKFLIYTGVYAFVYCFLIVERKKMA